MSRTLQGKFRPKNPEKYRGDAGNILYRSSWELKFMEWCDLRKEVLWWQSEEKRIPYYDPVTKRRRTYYPDFLLARECHDGIIRETLVEVKPARQVRGPADSLNVTTARSHCAATRSKPGTDVRLELFVSRAPHLLKRSTNRRSEITIHHT